MLLTPGLLALVRNIFFCSGTGATAGSQQISGPRLQICCLVRKGYMLWRYNDIQDKSELMIWASDSPDVHSTSPGRYGVGG